MGHRNIYRSDREGVHVDVAGMDVDMMNMRALA